MSHITHSKPNSGYFNTDDGIQLHYLSWPSHVSPNNNDSAPTCLCLHGFTNDSYIWGDFAKQLSATHRVIALDFRGHGDSAWDPYEHYTHYRLLEDVHQLITHLDLNAFHLIGHSLGARVGALYCAKYQPNLKSYTIIDTGPEVRAAGVKKVRQDAETTPSTFDSIAHYQAYLETIYLLANQQNIQQMAKHGVKNIGNNTWITKTDPAFTRALWHPKQNVPTMSSQTPSGIADSLIKNESGLKAPLDQQLWKALSRIRVPSLVLKGQVSAILSTKVAKKMVEEVMPNARLKIIKRAGHAVIVDNPDEFCKESIGFIRQIGN